MCLLSCFLGGWWEVRVQVCVWSRGTLLHGLPGQPEAQPEGRSRQSAGAGRRHCAPHSLWRKRSLPAGRRGAVCGRLALPRRLQLLTSEGSRCTPHIYTQTLPKSLNAHSKIQSWNCWAAGKENLALESFMALSPAPWKTFINSVSSQAKNEWGNNLRQLVSYAIIWEREKRRGLWSGLCSSAHLTSYLKEENGLMLLWRPSEARPYAANLKRMGRHPLYTRLKELLHIWVCDTLLFLKTIK